MDSNSVCRFLCGPSDNSLLAQSRSPQTNSPQTNSPQTNSPQTRSPQTRSPQKYSNQYNEFYLKGMLKADLPSTQANSPQRKSDLGRSLPIGYMGSISKVEPFYITRDSLLIKYMSAHATDLVSEFALSIEKHLKEKPLLPLVVDSKQLKHITDAFFQENGSQNTPVRKDPVGYAQRMFIDQTDEDNPDDHIRSCAKPILEEKYTDYRKLGYKLSVFEHQLIIARDKYKGSIVFDLRYTDRTFDLISVAKTMTVVHALIGEEWTDHQKTLFHQARHESWRIRSCLSQIITSESTPLSDEGREKLKKVKEQLATNKIFRELCFEQALEALSLLKLALTSEQQSAVKHIFTDCEFHF